MRRNILILAMSIFSIFVYSQHDIKLTKIPIEKMWMFKSGESYNDVLRKIKAEYPDNLLVEEKDLITIYDVKFAGVKFHGADLKFHKHTGLWSITFNDSNTKDKAKNSRLLYESLYKRISEKYGKGIIAEDVDNQYLTMSWYDLQDMGIVLSLHLSESNGGEDRWYVDLEYYNYNYYKKIQQSNMDDL